MPRTTSRLRTDPAARLTELGERRPEWLRWIAMLKEAQRALDGEAWTVSLQADPAGGAAAPADAPLLHQHVLWVDVLQFQRLLLRLANAASGAGQPGTVFARPPAAADVLALGTAAARQDSSTIERLARVHEADAGMLGSVAHLAVLPLLQTCGRRLRDQVPVHWPHGYCPICAAWPTLVESRGLDRSRRLRCGRCATEWELPWLRCIYCGELNHERLGSLVPDQPGETLKIETCNTCRGYLKSVATLQAIPPFDLLFQDLETVELDLVALERGYVRPAESGFRLALRMAAWESAPGSAIR